MCGIFGVSVKDKTKYTQDNVKETVKVLFKLSESRGKEAAGLAVKSGSSIDVLKLPISASDFLKSPQYEKFSADVFSKKNGQEKDVFLTVIGHSRLATHGTENLNQNNQPVIKEKAVCVHNGIIANDRQLWEKFPALNKEFQVDTEVLLGLLQLFFSETGSIVSAVEKVFEAIEGSASVGILFNNNRFLLLATNTGSLYICDNLAKDALIFASERYILEQFIKKTGGIDSFKEESIKPVLPGMAIVVDVQTLEKKEFSFLDKTRQIRILNTSHPETRIVDHSGGQNAVSSFGAPAINNFKIQPETKKTMTESWNRIFSEDKILRCTRCLLPETMPFIVFDEKGVCSFCKNHKPVQIKGEGALKKIVSKYRRGDGKPDCLVPFSGGRDSGYGLHYIKKELGMNPIAYTYDWGVLTDLGRRNQARICGKLGVEHIIISADIRTKRRNILMNLQAWLKRPELGMIPLLMAGDKQLLYYAEQLKKKTNVKLMIFSSGHGFEDDTFKVGFTGVSMASMFPVQAIPLIDKAKITKYYASQYLLNPSYINRSLFDTIFAFLSVFALPDINPHLYNFIKWDEDKVVSTIINEYNWELESDTKTTWRIDDGTAPFYNYIFMTVAGFTEFDTFRSAQIRVGDLSRKDAYELIKEESRPRFESIEWYARTIGFDPNKVIARINSIPKLHKL